MILTTRIRANRETRFGQCGQCGGVRSYGQCTRLPTGCKQSRSFLASFEPICDLIPKKTPLSSMRQGRFDVSVRRHKRMKRRTPITGKADDNKKDCENNFAVLYSGEWCRSRCDATGTDLESVRCGIQTKCDSKRSKLRQQQTCECFSAEKFIEMNDPGMKTGKRKPVSTDALPRSFCIRCRPNKLDQLFERVPAGETECQHRKG